MPQNKISLVDALRHPDFLLFAALFIAGTVTLAIKKKKKPVNFGELIGEIILAGGMATICWCFGLYNNLDAIQIALVGLPAAYGQVSLIAKLSTILGDLRNGRSQAK